jgi:gamma-glutamylcyclotransferase (GGCT)/AIG2-like uncharacterized protein YtfP
MKIKFKVAVYGSLMRGLHNHATLAGQKYLGTFQSEPIYTMYDVAVGSYPGIVKGGNTSVTFEVYEVDEQCLKEIDALESYYGIEKEETNYYNRKRIITPWGIGHTYFYNSPVNPQLDLKVETGNWRSYHELQRPKKYANS